MASRKDITVRFCLNKGDGDFVEKSKFAKDELADIRKCLSLELAYFPHDESRVKILNIEVIYDGITPFDEWPGYVINRKFKYPLEGYPAPVVRFFLNRSTDENEFLECIRGSSLHVQTKSMMQNDEDPYIAEDQNGYSSVLTSKQRDQEIIFLECHGAYCGKKFHFPDGIPEKGHFISAMEFALPSSNINHSP